MLDLEVIPERSIGNEQWQFILGMPFYQAVLILQKYDKLIKSLQIWYSEMSPLEMDLVIDMTQDGIRLIFDSHLQLLKIIEVYNMSKVKLKYCGSVFNSSSVPPTTQQIGQTFGATHPGVYDSENQLFVLSFTGLSFEFKLDNKYEPTYTHGFGALEFKHGASPLVSRVLIYTGKSLEKTWAPPMPLSCFYGNGYLENAVVVIENGFCTGVTMNLVIESSSGSKSPDGGRQTKETCVKFSDTCQDVLTALGSPSKMYYKDEHSMRIPHCSKSLQSLKSHSHTDFFFNYFTLGIDILFDGTTRTVSKFVLHSNFPGHYDFNTFYRCRFVIPLGEGLCMESQLIESTPQEITYDTKWHSVQDYLVPSGRKPVVLTRSSTTNTTNPFGCTYCHAVQNIIFEVLRNDHIATVTLFNPKLLL